MKRKQIALAALAAAAVALGTASAQAAPAATTPAAAASRQAAASAQPQQHFTSAIAAYARKDYKVAAAEIRKANRYLRIEAKDASGDARRQLDDAAAQLDKLAAAAEKGGLDSEKALHAGFSKAEHALALAHRAKAAESWARKDYRKAGYELEAAAHALQNAAAWSGKQAEAAASATVADTKALGGKLVSGAAYTRDEVAKGFEALGNGIETLGRSIVGTKTAAPLT